MLTLQSRLPTASPGSPHESSSHAAALQDLSAQPRQCIIRPSWNTEKVPVHIEAGQNSKAELWMVPRAANRGYIGRRELAERLSLIFSFDPLTPPTHQRIYVICGMGGIGKSEVCLKFSQDHRDEYWGVFWLNASSIFTAEQGFIDIGRRCGVAEPNVKNVMSWLACGSQRWLLILDNADDLQIDYSRYIPSGLRGDILLTTRNSQNRVYSTVGYEELYGLEPELARKLLFRAAAIEEGRWKDEAEDGMTVVNILDQHTLAIIQAGAYVRFRCCTLKDYLVIYNRQRQELLKSQPKDSRTHHNLCTASESAIEACAKYLLESNLRESKDALSLLHTFAFMHNCEISEDIFRMASQYAAKLRITGTRNAEEALPLSPSHMSRLPEYTQEGWSGLKHLRWRKACAVLNSLSLITIKDDHESITVSVHPIVHAWAKTRQDHISRSQAWQSAATVLAFSCQHWDTYYPSFISRHPHVRACVSHEVEDFTQHMSDTEAAQILLHFAYILYVMDDDDSLSSLIQRIRLRLQNSDEIDQEIKLQIKLFTGRVSLRQGLVSEAIDIFQDIVNVRSRTQVEVHPDLLAMQCELARAYKATGQVEKAIELLEHVVKVREKVAEDHPSHLASQHQLARIHQEYGHIDMVSNESSSQRSVSSIGSSGSSLSSNSSLDSIVTLRAAVVELKAMLANDERFSSLCTMAIGHGGIGVQKFERNLVRLIKRFAIGLSKEAAVHDKAGRAAAGLIKSFARRLAMEIIRTFTSEGAIRKEIEGARSSERDRHRELERSLAMYQSGSSEQMGLDLTSDMEIADDISSDDDMDNVKDDTAKDEEDIPNILQVKAFILASNAFSDMRRNLYRFLQPNVLQNISKEMKLEFNSLEQHTVTFHVQWDLLNFCQEELEGNHDLTTVLTITGTSQIAFATTCQDYVIRYWPKTGPDVLKFLESAIGRRTHQAQLSSHLRISMELSARQSPAKPEFALVRASGSRDDLIHIAQQLAWISAVFRVPKYGELSYSDVVFERTGTLQFTMILMDLQKVKKTDSSCWHPLFANCVLVRGFTTPNRGKENGIELPFEVMLSLACIVYPVEYHDGVILRGVSLTLVPIAHVSGSVQWHCVFSKQGSSLPRADEVMKQISEWFETSDLQLLKTARTFLGYCGEAEIHLGTRDTDYRSIQKSDAASERTRAEFSTSLAISAKGLITATVSPKITFSKGMRATTKLVEPFLEDRLLRARDQPLLLYDVEKRQGWLVPELSVVLHIAHAWVFQQPDIPGEVLDQVPYAVASVNGGKAAWDAILKGAKVELRKDSIDGKAQLFGDVIKNIIGALESRKELALGRDETSGIHLIGRPGLRGWEFVDMVNWKYLFGRKEVKIDRKTAGEWDLIAAERPDLVVLFCKGLGQPIRPAQHERLCRLWTPIPEGRYYLTASVPCLKRLSEDCGGTESCPKLTQSRHWHRPRGASLFENCKYGVENGCYRLQELMVKKKAVAPGFLEPHGAVIFGKSKQTLKTCCEPFEAPSEDQFSDTTAMYANPHHVEEGPLVAPVVVSGSRKPIHTRQDCDSIIFQSPYHSNAANGNENFENRDFDVMSPLVNIEVHQSLTERSLRGRPKI